MSNRDPRVVLRKLIVMCALGPMLKQFRDKIVNIDDMRPQDESTHWSKGLALYAIEMRQGWFATKGIVAGEKVTGLPAASAN